MSEEENADLIPPEDFAEAIAAFRANPDVDFMFTNAPHGAKLLLGLLFYKAHFRESADESQIQACLADIEGSLDDESIAYLLDCDIESNTKAYLARLRERIRAGHPAVSGTSGRAPSEPAGTPGDRIDYNFEAIRRRMVDREEEAAEEARKESETKAALRRRKLAAAGLRLIAGAVLLGAAAYGYAVWDGYRAKRAAEASEARRMAEERAREDEAERALQRARQEADAARRRAEREEARDKRRLADEEMKEQREKAREEQAARNKAWEEERAKKLREEAARREKHDSLLGFFRKASVGAWGELGAETRRNVFAMPGCFLVPDEVDPDGLLYEVRVAIGTNGIFLISGHDVAKPVERDVMTDILLKNGALYMAGDRKVYCITPQHADGARFPVPGYSCCPAELLLEGVWKLMQRYGMDSGSLFCEVIYAVDGGKKSSDRILVGELDLGRSLSRPEMTERVVGELMKRKRPYRDSVRPKRATVVLYDGDIIKRGADGITYVPRSPRGRVPSNYYRLYDEAKRQEARREEMLRNADRADDEYRERITENVKASFEKRCIDVRLISR